MLRQNTVLGRIGLALFTMVVLFAEILSADVHTATFNIKWVGYSTTRDNAGIAKMLSDTNRDLVFVQEVVSPPVNVSVPGKIIPADSESRAFFNAMTAEGYSYILSPEDTGTGDTIHTNSAATEWFVAFYKPSKLTPLRSGYVAYDRSNHPDYERVPYSFTFRTRDGMDFTVVSTHLKPGNTSSDRARRYHELTTLMDWADDEIYYTGEEDMIILGDMNVYDCNTLDYYISGRYVRANTKCQNSNLKFTEPYDQVIYRSAHTYIYNYHPVNMYNAFYVSPYISNSEMIARYSDHHPVFFSIGGYGDDD